MAARRNVVSIAAMSLVLVAGCRPAAVNSNATPGATSAQSAVTAFLSAARAQDLQALSAVWGNDVSPTRDRVERQELERRLLVMMCHLRHEESRIDVPQRGEAGRTLFPVELKQGSTEAKTTFTVIKNTESGRWYVEDFDLRPLRPFCTQMPPPGGRTPDATR